MGTGARGVSRGALRALGVAAGLALLLGPVGAGALDAQERSAREYELKAAFLYNFTKFVDWPEDGGRDRHICVLGDDPFGPSLEALAGRTTRGRIVTVSRFRDLEQVPGCHVVFVSDAVEGDLEPVLARLADAGVLTVGESGDFADRGGMIALETFKNRIRLTINLEAAGRAELGLSSHLVRLAELRE